MSQFLERSHIRSQLKQDRSEQLHSQDSQDKEEDERDSDPPLQRYIVKNIRSKRLRKGHIEYFVEWDNKTPKEDCWVPFQILREAMDSVAEFEFNVGQDRYKKGIVTQLQSEVVKPLLGKLQSMQMGSTIVRVKDQGKKAKVKKVKRVQINLDDSNGELNADHEEDDSDYFIQKDKTILYDNYSLPIIDPLQDIEIMSLEGSSAEKEYEEEQVEKIMKCIRNSKERSFLFMVKWKKDDNSNQRRAPDVLTAKQLMEKAPNILADFLLEVYRK